MKNSIVLFFIAATVTSVYANEDTQPLETIKTARRLLKIQTKLLEHSTFLPISYVANLISMNKENLSLVQDDVIGPSLVLLDQHLEDALDALEELKKVPTANNNHMVTPREKIKFFQALKKANVELDIIDDMLHIPSA